MTKSDKISLAGSDKIGLINALGNSFSGQTDASGRPPQALINQLLPLLTTTNSSAPVSLSDVPTGQNGTVIPQTAQSGPLIRIDQFRADPRFAGINGNGFATVILDTGINRNHPFFGPDTNADGISDRIVYQYDFAYGDSNAQDFNGHGSNVTSIVASQDSTYRGMAPNANIISLKVLDDTGAGNFSYVEQALQWVVANAATYNIASVNMSLGDGGNYNTDQTLYGINDELAALAALRVTVVSASGNDFFPNSVQGNSYPAADPNSLSVGAVWDGNNGGPFNWFNGAVDNTTGADRITSFSQRSSTQTDIFAPGAVITGAAASGTGTLNESGTSQASPHIAGIAVLAQQLAVQKFGRRLTQAEFVNALQTGGITINDGDNEDDNVTNTGLNFKRVDMPGLGNAILALTPPSNDNFANRVTLSGSSTSTTGTNVNATGEIGEPNHANASGTLNSVWWNWTAPSSGNATINTIGSNFDTTLGVYTGSSVSGLTTIAGDDDSGGSGTSSVTFPTTAGTDYKIAVDGFSSFTGNINLGLSLNPGSTVVTNTNDSGAGSLRQAILNANSNVGTDTISFNIPGSGVQTITPLSELPVITDPVTIDGTTQPGFSGAPIIELNGIASPDNGLSLTASNNTIKGLVINRFGTVGIFIQPSSSGNIIQGNYIGTDATGTLALGSIVGISINGPNNTIGGLASNLRNVISGNRNGILISGAGGANSANNYIGGNYIGTQANGLSALGNAYNGVVITQSSDNSVGGGNTIAFNGLDGIHINSGANNRVVSNSIFSNGGLGIELGTNGVTPNDPNDTDTGPNDYQNFPVINSATSNGSNTTIGGTLNSTPNSAFYIEFFSNSSLDPSGYGEGQNYLGFISVNTDSSGNATFNSTFPTNVPVGQYITATTTTNGSSYNPGTSEFSAGRIVSASTTQTDLGISITDNATSVVAGGNLNYTITASNNGPNPVSNATVNINLANLIFNSITYVGVTGTGGASGFDFLGAAGTNLTDVGVNLPVNATVTYTISGTVGSGISSGTNIVSSADISATGITDTTLNNNSASDTTTVTTNVISFTTSTTSGNEGNSGSAVNQVVATVQRTGGSSGAISVPVQLAASPGTATAGSDYTNIFPITVNFANGDTTSKTVSIPIIGDTVNEPIETINLQLGTPTGGATLGSQSTATYSILNDDTPSGLLQQVTPDFDSITVGNQTTRGFRPNNPVSFDVNYSTSDNDNTLPGLGLRLFYNSTQLNYTSLTNVLSNDLLAQGTPQPDTTNQDGDASTDSFVNVAWTNFSGNWPNVALPTKLYTANFTASPSFTGSTVNFFSNNTAAGYTLSPTSAVLTLAPAISLDADGNGIAQGSTDGILIARYLFGFTGTTLTNGAIGSGATRTSPTDIQTYLAGGTSTMLDVDGNGIAQGSTDGILVARYLFGFTGTTLTNGAIGSGATRTSATQIQNFLQQYLPTAPASPLTLASAAVLPSSSFAHSQVITAIPSTASTAANTPVSIKVNYKTTDNDATVSALGLRLHFDSSQLKFNDLSSVLPNNLLAVGTPEADIKNFDNDPTTDTFINVAWADLANGNWPGEIPADLYTANFTTKPGFKDTTVNFSSSNTTAGYGLQSSPTTISTSTSSDRILGTSANDVIIGSSSNDTITGIGSGEVTNPGRGEVDSLVGGAGTDTFVLGDILNSYYNDNITSNPGLGDYALIQDFKINEDFINLKSGLNYLIGASPSGLPSGSGIFIDNDGIPGFSANDELIAVLQDVAPSPAIKSRFVLV